MRRFEVTFRRAAERDLSRLYDHIASEADAVTAHDYIRRIEEVCMSLEVFPERGTRRDDLRPGLRIVGFDRRVTIAFQVMRIKVRIIRVLYGGQDYERVLRGGR